MNFYNEKDPYAAQWLRNLSDAGHIGRGIVANCDVQDVISKDFDGASQCHFFAGIGVWSHALRLAGWPDDRPVWTGSCPCQPFSQAGRGNGVRDERHLWPEWFRLIRECRPAIVFGEQVSNPSGLDWFDSVSADLEREGYAVGASDLCAASVGAPHIRQRLYFVAIAGGEPRRLHLLEGKASREVSEAGGCSEARGVGHAMRDGGEGSAKAKSATKQVLRSAHHAGTGAGQVADASEPRRSRGRSGEESEGQARESRRLREARDVAFAEGGRRKEGSAGEGHSSKKHGPRSVDARVLGDSSGIGSGRNARALSGAQARSGEEGIGRGHLADEPLAAGATHFWSDADWLPCKDGKLRPVEPGTFPLAHGAASRVGRLRAYGNAIVPQVAAAFIRSVQDVLEG